MELFRNTIHHIFRTVRTVDMKKNFALILLCIIAGVSFLCLSMEDSYADDQTYADQYSGRVTATCTDSSSGTVFKTLDMGLEINLDGLYDDSTIKASDYAELFNPVWTRNNSSATYYSFEFNDPGLDTISITEAHLRWREDAYTTFAKTAEGVVICKLTSVHKDECRTTSSLEIYLLHTCEMEPVIDVQPSCTEDGQGHDVCTVCGHISQPYVIPAAHNWDSDYTIDREATCTADGIKSIHCSACDATKDEVAIPADHEWEDFYTIDRKATCTQDGLKAIHCKKCTEIKEERIIPATGHDNPLEHFAAKDVTCTENGNSEYWHCTKCDEYFSDEGANTAIAKNSWIIKAPGHTWDKGTVTKKATCTVDGTRTFKCSKCNRKKTEAIKATGHTWKHYKKAAGLLMNGTEYDYCTVCNTKKNVKTLVGYATYYVKSFKVAKAKKAFTAKWAKQSASNQKKFNGYQIRYSTRSNMSGAKTVTATKSSRSKKISKLKAKTKYYVQVRTYTKKNGNTFYSKWSTKKTVKTK